MAKPVPLPKPVVEVLSNSPKAKAARAKAQKNAVKKSVPFKNPITAGDVAAGKKAIAAAKKAPGKKAPVKKAAPVNRDNINSTTTGTTTMQAPNANLLPGAVDPFAGTPYAGMSPYQIAQKIVQDEIDAQTKGINAQRDAQVQANTNALSILSQLGQQLQAGAGQFATNYNASLQGTGIGGGGAPQGGVPDTGQKSFQGFQSGYAAAQGLINGGMGASNPNQEGGPSAAAPLPQGVNGGDAQNITNTAISTNPFTVLPAAYGRMAQMDATLLAANQAKSLTAYSQAVLDLYASANKDIFDEFNQIKSEFDAANGAVTSARADQDAAAAAKAKADQGTYQWQYAQASKLAARLSSLNGGNGHIWLVNPKTLVPYDTGRLTPAAQKAGFKNKPKATVQHVNVALSDRYHILYGTDGKPILDANGNTQKIPPAPAAARAAGKWSAAPEYISAAAGVIMGYDPKDGKLKPMPGGGKYVPSKSGKGAKGSQASTQPGTPAFKAAAQKNIATTNSKLRPFAQSMKKAGGTKKTWTYHGTTKDVPFWVDNNGNVSYVPGKGKAAASEKDVPSYDRAAIWQQVYNNFKIELFTYFREAYPQYSGTGYYQKRINAMITQAVGWGPHG